MNPGGMLVLPARNEGPRVAAVVHALRTVLPGIPALVVVNGSTDDTASRALEAGAEVLRSPPGYAGALRVGLGAARARGCAWAIQLDADGQHPAEALPRLLEALESADLVVGSRFLGDPGYVVPPLRRLAIAGLSRLASWRAATPLTDVTSGLRAWNARALDALVPAFPEPVADGNLLVRAVRAGLRVREVHVPMRARAGGVGMHDGPHALAFAARSVFETCRVRP
jgi:glycosyltransferase involved in cell wall biosynthesis